MKTIEEINTILCHEVSDEEFEILLDAEYDRLDLDRRIARNGLARLTRHLAKHGLTVAEWDAWDATC